MAVEPRRTATGSGAGVRGRGVPPLWLALTTIWVATAGTLEIASVATGAAAALAIALWVARASPVWGAVGFAPRRLVATARYGLAFLRELVRSNISLMRQVYAPRLRVAPAVITAPVRLRSPMGRLMLTNSIALTPGTLVIDLAGDAVRVHVIDAAVADPQRLKASITDAFEPHLERAFG